MLSNNRHDWRLGGWIDFCQGQGVKEFWGFFSLETWNIVVSDFSGLAPQRKKKASADSVLAATFVMY